MRNLEEFNQKHTGQTAFLIGAGPSIIDLNLVPLKDHVTIAINSGYCAYEDADYFLTDDYVQNWSYFFQDLVQSSKTIAFLYENELPNR